ncbi:MAG: TMEM143 family protein [Hyphomicrobiaceae bacterium]|nr:TMEM143 family protein [Hyphomicrobiaceae bacterium]
MSTAAAAGKLNGATGPGAAHEAPSLPVDSLASAAVRLDADAALAEILARSDTREKFIPVTRDAIIERLSADAMWPAGMAGSVRKFFRYLNQWRQQSYGAKLIDLARLYEPFSPDSDLLVTRQYSEAERKSMEAQLVDGVCGLMQQANYVRIDPSHVDLILTKDSAYGLDLHVDLDAFDELEIYYRGATKRTDSRRSLRNLYLRKEEFDVPIFQRLAILFKLKPEAKRVEELMRKHGISLEQAERRVRRLRGPIASYIKPEFIYVKLFKNIPRSDIEMVFPNTMIRFRLFDKIKLGVTASGGLGMGVAGTLSKIAVATNPIALAGAVAGLGGIAVRQAVNFMNQRNKYMVKMAQNLYSHALADNRGVMTLLAERAAEEDVKEEILLYSLLVKEHVTMADLGDADAAIENYLATTFGIDTNFDVQDALRRLVGDGLVRIHSSGHVEALQPVAAAARIDELWDAYLDNLPDVAKREGSEYEGERVPLDATT